MRIAAAAGCVAVAAAIRAAIQPTLGHRFPYFTIFVAVLVCTRYFGLGPGLFSAIFGAILGLWFAPWSEAAVNLIVYLAGCALSIWFLDTLHRAQEEANDRLALLQAEASGRMRNEQMSAQLRAVVESSEDAIIARDLEGVIRSWNRGAEQLFGYTAQEAIGKPASMLTPPDRRGEEQPVLESILRGGRAKHFETVRTHKDGRRIAVSLTISPIFDAAGKVTGVSDIARDITERIAFEEQFRQTQKLESLGVLAGGLAHDFNNLLTGIVGNASLAMEDLDRPEAARTRIQEILGASERASVLVRQMLAYAGKGPMVLERLDLGAQVKEALPLLHSSVPRLVKLELRLEADAPPVHADRAQIQQLILNLAVNAAEAIGDGPGEVMISVFGREREAERQAVLEVKDTGAGMDEETRQRIFDPFFTTKFTGRGLGLAAALGIIRTHRGTIDVDSAPGRGSTFTVVLPAAESAEPTISGGEAELRGSGHVLVVDDEEFVRNMARFALEKYGYTVDLAADGRAAVEMFAARPDDYSAVLLDLTMPVMGGEEALRRIQEIRPGTAIVLSSGFSETQAVAKLGDRQARGFLQKPYTATALARKLKQAIQSARAIG